MRLWPRKRVYVDDLPQTHDVRFATIFLLGIITLLGGVYLVGYFAAGDKLPTGTSVEGIDVGGMQRDEARTVLQTKLTPRLNKPFTGEVLGDKFTFTPQQVGLTYDLDATLDNGLGGGSWDPRHMWKVVSGGDEIPAVVDIDSDDLDTALDRVARRVAEPAVDAKVDLKGGISVEPSRTGVALDYPLSRRRVTTILKRSADSVDFAVKSVPSQVTTEEAERFVADVVKPAVADPVEIEVGEDTIRIPTADFESTLSVTSSDGKLMLDVDSAAFLDATKQRVATASEDAVDAQLTFRGGAPVIIPSEPGFTVDEDEWAASLLSAVQRPSRHARAKVTPVQPTFSTKDAEALGIKESVAAVRVELDRQVDLTAVEEAADSLGGTLVESGQEFSFLDHVDAQQETAASLVASATFQVALESGMAQLDRTQSAHISGMMADGFDSLVSEPGTDLAWRNDTPDGVYIRTAVSDTGGKPTLRVELWSTPFHTVKTTTSDRYGVVEPGVERDSSADCRPRPGEPGFNVDVTRQFADTDSSEQVESFSSHYTPRDAVECR